MLSQVSNQSAKESFGGRIVETKLPMKQQGVVKILGYVKGAPGPYSQRQIRNEIADLRKDSTALCPGTILKHYTGPC